jgi:hypothetical protein
MYLTASEKPIGKTQTARNIGKINHEIHETHEKNALFRVFRLFRGYNILVGALPVGYLRSSEKNEPFASLKCLNDLKWPLKPVN